MKTFPHSDPSAPFRSCRPLKVHLPERGDWLTALPTGSEFADRVASLLRDPAGPSPQLTLMSIEAAGIRDAIGGFGRAVGEQLIVAAAQRLVACLPPRALVARFDGAEFGVCLEGEAIRREAIVLAERVLDRLSQAFGVDGREFHLRPRLGIAVSEPRLARAADLVRAADIALHEIAAGDDERYRFFDHAMAERVGQRFSLEAELRLALGRDELRLYYQPQIDLGTGAIVAAEALVRWQHPRRGLLTPAEFLPVAEQTGLIVPIDDWVLREGTRQAAEWRKETAVGSRLVVTINVSARQFQSPGFAESLATAVQSSGVSPRRLELEAAGSYLHDAATASAILTLMRHSNVRLALDGFGLGGVPLSWLREAPVDTIKIDRTCLPRLNADLLGRQFVEATVGIARACRAVVVAEGVESPEQVAWLRGLGVDRGQGYWFSSPLPAPDLGRMLAEAHRFPLPDPVQQRAGRRQISALPRATPSGTAEIDRRQSSERA